MKFQGFQTEVNQRKSFSEVGKGVVDAQQIQLILYDFLYYTRLFLSLSYWYLLPIVVDILEAILHYELVSDGKVIVRDREDGVYISSPDLLVVRLQKGVKKKKKVGKGIRRNFRTHGSFYIFKHLQSLPSTPRNGLYRNYRFCSLKIPAKLKETFPINWKKPSNYINQKVYHTNLTCLR